MAFLETPRFPDEIAFWCDGGPQFLTQVSESLSGFEQRNQLWSQPRCKFDIGGALRTSAEYVDATYSINVVRNYFYSVRGRLHGFRLKDFTDYKDDAGGILGTGNGATTAFQMVKRYTTGAFTTDRQIKKPVTATIQVYKDAVLQTLTTHYTLNSTTGVVTFVTAPANGTVLTWTGQFDVPVRFEQDNLMMRMEGGLYQIQSLSCVEIRL